MVLCKHLSGVAPSGQGAKMGTPLASALQLVGLRASIKIRLLAHRSERRCDAGAAPSDASHTPASPAIDCSSLQSTTVQRCWLPNDARGSCLIAQEDVITRRHESFLPAPHTRLRLAGPAHHFMGAGAVRPRQYDLGPPNVLVRGVLRFRRPPSDGVGRQA
jgi:hypothetical protein